MENKEIEVRFLEIDKAELIQKLKSIGAIDNGEVMLEEVIVYDKDLAWKTDHKRIRVRRSGQDIMLSYKENKEHLIDSTIEIEFKVGDFDQAVLFLEKIGFNIYRRQQKYRHTFAYKNVVFDIDTWPKIPTYVEIEGESEKAIKDAAKAVGLNWAKVVTKPPALVIEENYNIPVRQLKWFTFDRVE